MARSKLRGIFAFLLCSLIIFSSLGIITYGEGDSPVVIAHIFDDADCLTDDEEATATNYIAHVALELDCGVLVYFVDDLEGKTSREFVDEQLEFFCASEPDWLVLLFCEDFDSNEPDWIGASGRIADIYTSEFDSILDAMYIGLDSGGYFAAVKSFSEYFIDSTPDSSEPDAPLYKGVVTCYDSSLSADEVDLLQDEAIAVAETIKCHVGVVIADDLGGVIEDAYTINWANETFGKGENVAVLLLCNDHINYDYFYTYGVGTDLYDSDTDAIFDIVYSGLDAGGFYSAVTNYFAALRKYCSADVVSGYNDYSQGDNYYYVETSGSELDYISESFIPPLLMFGVVALIVTFGMRAHWNNAYDPTPSSNARTYLIKDKLCYTHRSDVYVRSVTTTRTISSSSSGHRSGGSRSRSGGGGRRRSGGGGGRGRRR